METNRPSKTQWWIVGVVFLAGAAASIGGNVAHADPGLGSQLAAAWAPAALFCVIEILVHIPAPNHWFSRWLRHIGVGAVAAVAALASYRGMRGQAHTWGMDDLTAALLPISVDGTVLVASLSLLALAERRRAAIASEATAAAATAPAAAAARAVTAAAELAAAAGAEAAASDAAEVVAEATAITVAAAPSGQDLVVVAAFDAETQELWEAARAVWLAEAANGRALIGKQLGDMFGRSERWGRERIAEAKLLLPAAD